MVMKPAPTTLSPRGHALAQQQNMRDMAGIILDKYDPKTNPDGWAILGVAENYCMLPEIASYIAHKRIHLSANDFSYNEGPWSTKRLREALATLINKRFKPVTEVKESELCMANGLTPLCSMLGYVCCEDGDGILISQPCYGAFVEDFGRVAKAKMVMVPFRGVDQFSVEGVECYKRALEEAEAAGTRIRALLLCNPHNPLGRCYPRETVVEIMKFCQENKIHLFSDEIYGMSVYDTSGDELAVPFESVLSFDTSEYISPDYLHMLYAMSKDLGAGGLRVGCLVSGNQELRKAMDQLVFFHWTGIADQRVAIEILEDEACLESFLHLSRKRLKDHSALTRSILDGKGIKYAPGSNAGFFLVVDLRPFLRHTGKEGWETEAALVQKMMGAKLFLTSGEMMKSEEPGWFRLVFSQDQQTLREGLRRLFEVLGL